MTTFPPPETPGPAQDPLDGCAPAKIGARLASHLLDMVLVSLTAVAVLSFIDPTWPRREVLFYLAISAAALCLLLIVTVAVSAATPGGLMLGHRHVATASGRISGSRAVAKYVVEAVVILPSAGLLGLTLPMTTREPWGQHWLDRMFAVAVIDVRRGRNPARQPSPNLPPEPVRQWGVQTVGLPEDQALIREIPLWADPAPIAPVPSTAHSRPTNPPANHRVGAPLGAMLAPAVMRARAAATGQLLVPPAPAMDTDAHHPTEKIASVERTVRRVSLVPVVRLMSGDEHPVDAVLVFGRNPINPAGWGPARLIELPDPGRSMSKTHVAIGPAGSGVWVQDLDSTNGVRLTDPQGVVRVLTPGVRASADLGYRISIGDHELTIVGG